MGADALPDFLVVGAMKCGTSTLAAQLAAQPGAFVTDPKEPNFFSDDEVWARGLPWYRGLFAEAAPGDLKGEASTHYTKLPIHPETLARIRPVLAAPRIVYVIRDPLARAVSHLIHAWSQGEVDRAALADPETVPGLVDYGRYGMQIAPWIAAYGADAVHLTSLEAVKADPSGELARIGAHIGLGATTWRDDLEARNVSAERMRRLPMQGLLIDNPVARALRRTLVPKAVRTRIRATRTIGDRPTLSDATRARLTEVYAADRAVLARHFPDHPALRMAYPFLKT